MLRRELELIAVVYAFIAPPHWARRLASPLRWLWWLLRSAVMKQLVWMSCVMLPAWRSTAVLLERLFPRADPLYIYRIPRRLARLLWTLVTHVLRLLWRVLQRLWRAYAQLLAAPTTWSRRMDSRAAEIAVMPLAFAWMGWPLALPVLFSRPSLWMVAGTAVAVQVVLGRQVIHRAWYGGR